MLGCENGFETVLAAGVFSLVVLQVGCVFWLFCRFICGCVVLFVRSCSFFWLFVPLCVSSSVCCDCRFIYRRWCLGHQGLGFVGGEQNKKKIGFRLR